MQEDKFKALLAGTKMHASENLKFRIMQQIETESALARQRKRQERPAWSNLSIFGLMYIVIAIVGFFVYSSDGESALKTTTFFVPVMFVAAVFGVFFLISTFDDRRYNKQRK